MEKRKPLDEKDIGLMDEMIQFLIGVHNETVDFCDKKCPYFSSCEDFAGACAIQTVKSVANWGWRILIEQKNILEKGKK